MKLNMHRLVFSAFLYSQRRCVACLKHLGNVVEPKQVFLLNYSDAPQQTDAAAHVVRVELTKNLG
jgi:hypothetical protein